MKMLKKLVSIVTMLAFVNAGLLPTTPVENSGSYDPHPRYAFSYNVHDSETGDVKSQTEYRDGDVVHGSYSLNDADGYRRVVEYTSDPERGFNAVVRREPLSAVQIATQKPIVVLKPAAETIYQQKRTNVQHPVVSSYTQPTALVRTYSPSTIIHHGPVLHSTPVHLSSAAHIVQASPVSAALRHQAVVKTSLHTPHVSLVF